MNVVVVGYGRVGSALAREAIAAGHSVTVIDSSSDRVQRAARLPGARVVTGNAVDVQVQRDAHVGSADLFLAVTSNDNVNLVAAEIAVEVFQVINVVARVYAPSRAQVDLARRLVARPGEDEGDRVPLRLEHLAQDQREALIAGRAAGRAALGSELVDRLGLRRLLALLLEIAGILEVDLRGGQRGGRARADARSLALGEEVDAVARDPQEPGAEAAQVAGAQIRDRVQRLDDRLLEHVFGLDARAQRASRDRADRLDELAAQTLDERAQR